jgi:glycogen debranching enzyme
MDARVDGVPVTQRAGKPVEVDALWVAADPPNAPA